MARSRIPIYGGVFFTAMSILLFEISLTRVFAVMMWHHCAPVVVSLALLGFGASGSLLTAGREPERSEDPTRRLAGWASWYGLSVILGFCFVTLIRVDTLYIAEPRNLLALLFCYLVISVPFLMGGFAIGISLSRYPDFVGKIYFADLVASGLGGAAAALLLGSVGATASVMVAGLLGLLGAVCFSWNLGGARRAFQIVLMVPAALLVLGFSGGGLGVPALHWDIPFAPDKSPGAPHFKQAETTLYSPVAQVDVSPEFLHHMSVGGHFGDVDWQEQVPLRGVAQDGTAPTALYRDALADGAWLDRFPSLDDTQAASAYVAFAARGGEGPDVLAIGVGGGIDVMIALAHGASAVTGVEINGAMVQMVTENYHDYIGGLFDHPDVTLVKEEGRSFLRRGSETYDIIQMSGVDTYTALSMGAHTLGESYLYTVEAVQDFYAKLEPGGYVNYSRFLMTWPEKPRETIRLVNTAREALEEIGVEDPASQICVLQAHGWASTMIKKGPFTAPEVERLRSWAAAEHFMGLAFDPLRKPGDPLESGRLNVAYFLGAATLILEEASRQLPESERRPLDPAWVRLYASSLRDASEHLVEDSDRWMERLRDALPAGLAPKLTPALRAARDQGVPELMKVDDYRNRLEHFREVQRSFTTLLQGSKEERQSFIDSYVYALEPAVDDRPFFFDYFKLGSWESYGDLWKEEARAGWHPNFPVGHAVLLISMLQIVTLGLVLIILPIRRLERQGVHTERRMRYFLYFAALGMGFMFIEISLMQKFVLFLGNPTYSLSVVLAGMLVFSGLGALTTSRIPRASRLVFYGILVAIAGVVAVDLWVVNNLLSALLGWPLWGRILVTLGVMAYTSFFLGMAFPLGVRVLKARDPVLIPWGWAINGFVSVFSSLLTIVLAMWLGFSWVLVIAVGVYAIGLIPMVTEPRVLEGSESGA